MILQGVFIFYDECWILQYVQCLRIVIGFTIRAARWLRYSRRLCSELRKATSEEDNGKNLNKILYFLLISPTLPKRGKDTLFERLC